jgi:energy-coupling factor transporter ATP-binding protein EcfA2
VTGRPADNPFASRRIDRLKYRFQRDDVQAIAERLRCTDGRGSVIGPHGSGKTTLLEHLAGQLDGRLVWLRLNAQTVRPLKSAIAALPDSVTSGHTVLIDGSEQLGPWAWWRLHRRVRKAGAIVMTSHGPGRLPTIHACTTSPELLTKLVGELAPDMADVAGLDELFHRHDGNIRLCFRELYDLWASS